MKPFFLTAFLMICTLFITSCKDDFENSDCSELCDLYEGTPFTSKGDCVSLCTTCFNPSESAGNMAVCVCNYVDVLLKAEGEEWKDFGVKNKGQCIKLVKSEINAGNTGGL